MDAADDRTNYAARIERNYRTSLRCWWSREFGYLSVLDPFTGEVYDIERTKDTPRWMIWRCMDEKARKRASTGSTGTSPAWRRAGSSASSAG